MIMLLIYPLNTLGWHIQVARDNATIRPPTPILTLATLLIALLPTSWLKSISQSRPISTWSRVRVSLSKQGSWLRLQLPWLLWMQRMLIFYWPPLLPTEPTWSLLCLSPLPTTTTLLSPNSGMKRKSLSLNLPSICQITMCWGISWL